MIKKLVSIFIAAVFALSAQIQSHYGDGKSGGLRLATENAVYFDYTPGYKLPDPELFSITASSGPQQSVGYAVTYQTVSGWLDVSLSSYITPAVLTIKLNPNNIPPAGEYFANVKVTSNSNSLNWVVMLKVKQADSTGTNTAGIKVLSHLACGGDWSTTLYFSSTDKFLKTSKLWFYKDNGAKWTDAEKAVLFNDGDAKMVMMGPNGTQKIVLNKFICGSLQTGYVVTDITATSPVTGYAVFRQSVSGREDQEAVVPFSYGTMDANITFDETASVTAVALANTYSGNTIIQATAYSWDGFDVIGSTSISLAKGEKVSFVLSDKITQLRNKKQQGLLRMTATSGNFTGLGFRFLGSAFTSIPFIPVAK